MFLSILFVMKRSAFTLVELLVVIVVIALLAGILLTAINRSRETARRAQCVSRQRDLAIALIDYNNASNGLPGYLNQFGGTTPIHSWAVSIFPMIGENKRYEVLMNNGLSVLVSPPALLCPSDNPDEPGRLNYVVNCGPKEYINDNLNLQANPAFVLFRDRRSLLPQGVVPSLVSINTKVKIEEIPDGASNTILLSENLEVGVWYANWSLSACVLNQLPVGVDSQRLNTRSSAAVENLGFVWWDTALAPNSSTAGPRPSSKHPGTVVAAYADGSAKPINDDISLGDWLQAVCPDDKKAKGLITDGGLEL